MPVRKFTPSSQKKIVSPKKTLRKLYKRERVAARPATTSATLRAATTTTCADATPPSPPPPLLSSLPSRSASSSTSNVFIVQTNPLKKPLQLLSNFRGVDSFPAHCAHGGLATRLIVASSSQLIDDQSLASLSVTFARLASVSPEQVSPVDDGNHSEVHEQADDPADDGDVAAALAAALHVYDSRTSSVTDAWRREKERERERDGDAGVRTAGPAHPPLLLPADTVPPDALTTVAALARTHAPHNVVVAILLLDSFSMTLLSGGAVILSHCTPSLLRTLTKLEVQPRLPLLQPQPSSDDGTLSQTLASFLVRATSAPQIGRTALVLQPADADRFLRHVTVHPTLLRTRARLLSPSPWPGATLSQTPHLSLSLTSGWRFEATGPIFPSTLATLLRRLHLAIAEQHLRSFSLTVDIAPSTLGCAFMSNSTGIIREMTGGSDTDGLRVVLEEPPHDEV